MGQPIVSMEYDWNQSRSSVTATAAGTVPAAGRRTAGSVRGGDRGTRGDLCWPSTTGAAGRNGGPRYRGCTGKIPRADPPGNHVGRRRRLCRAAPRVPRRVRLRARGGVRLVAGEEGGHGAGPGGHQFYYSLCSFVLPPARLCLFPARGRPALFPRPRFPGPRACSSSSALSSTFFAHSSIIVSSFSFPIRPDLAQHRRPTSDPTASRALSFLSIFQFSVSLAVFLFLFLLLHFSFTLFILSSLSYHLTSPLCIFRISPHC